MNETFTLNVTPQLFNIIIAGLDELPHKVSRQAIDNLVTQVKQQSEAKSTPEPTAQQS